MKDKAKVFLTVGIVFLVIGIILLIAVSRTIAYGDFVLAFVFLGMYTREKKKTYGDNKDK